MPSMFSLELISKEDEKGITPWTDDDRLALGAAVEISMGYGDDRESLIVGEITALEPTFSIAGAPTLVVRGYDKRHRLNAVPRTHTFTDKTDSEIAEEVCSRVNVPVTATKSDVKHPYVLQGDQTDLSFLQERAQRIHYELAVDIDGTMLFRPRRDRNEERVTSFIGRRSARVSTAHGARAADGRPSARLGPEDRSSRSKRSATSGDEVSAMDGLRSAAQFADVCLRDARRDGGPCAGIQPGGGGSAGLRAIQCRRARPHPRRWPHPRTHGRARRYA